MPSTLRLTADLIGSRDLASTPGGHAAIHDRCTQMRSFLDKTLNQLNYDRTVTIEIQNPLGDDIAYQLEASSPQTVADVAVATAIRAFLEDQAGRFFRYVIFSVESGKTYFPRIKVFSDLSKTNVGKRHHIAIERGVVSSIKDSDLAGWLNRAPHVATELKLKGEPWPAVYVDLYCPVGDAGAYAPAPVSKEVYLAEKTYLRYRTEQTPLLESRELIHHLEKRYSCRALIIGGKPLPVTVLWENSDQLIDPEHVLGDLDFSEPVPTLESATLPLPEYAEARSYICAKYRSGSIKSDGCEYRMTRIDVSSDVPKMSGAFGFYSDSILTQYAIEWELKKALLQPQADPIRTLSIPGTLPLRESVEIEGSPLVSGNGRCAAITVSTFLVFKRPTNTFACLIRRRSSDVCVSPGMLHVVPAGMFEAGNTGDPWSITLNIWRELLEEVYDEKEQQGAEFAESLDDIVSKEPIRLLRQLLRVGSAELTATGIVCDLLNLRPEVCTVLFVADPRFAEIRRMQLNWEYEPEPRQGKFLVEWGRIDDVIGKDGAKYGIVPSGAACLALGREWVRRHHGM
jgi:hypothetical protein